MHEGVELILGESAILCSFALVTEDSFVRRSEVAIPTVEIVILIFHVILFDGAEVEISCLCDGLNIDVAIAFISMNRSLFWSNMFKTFRINHVGVSDGNLVDHP